MQKGVSMLASKNKGLLVVMATLAMAALLTSCGTTFMVAADDVYGNMPSREQERRQRLEKQWKQSGNQRQETVADDSYSYRETTYDTFDYDNYYDYEYSSRLRRFQNDDFVSDDYYSDYYTNSYWYDYNPGSYGTSIYLGYDWWYPRYTYYRPGWSLGFSYGPFAFSYGSYWGCGGYYSCWPGYSWNYGHGYHHGYHNGYWNGYWDGYWDGRYGNSYDYCYNPYDRNTYTQSYYGRRTRGSSLTNPSVATSSVRRASTGTMAASSTGSTPSLPTATRRTFAERYEHAVGGSASTISTSAAVSEKNTGASAVVPTRRVSATPSTMMENVSNRLATKETVQLPSRPSTPVQPNQPTRRYGTTVNPAATGTPQRTTTTQQQPVRGTQYARPSQSVNPAGQQPSNPRTREQSQPRQYNTPVYDRSRSTSSYVSPRYNNSSRSATAAPARSTATPARSTSVSSPRSSSGSTSRSSGSSSPSGSSSSSGSSTRRTR